MKLRITGFVEAVVVPSVEPVEPADDDELADDEELVLELELELEPPLALAVEPAEDPLEELLVEEPDRAFVLAFDFAVAAGAAVVV